MEEELQKICDAVLALMDENHIPSTGAEELKGPTPRSTCPIRRQLMMIRVKVEGTSKTDFRRRAEKLWRKVGMRLAPNVGRAVGKQSKNCALSHQ